MGVNRNAMMVELSPAEIVRFQQQWKVDGEPSAYTLWCNIMGRDDATRQPVYSMLNHANSHTNRSTILAEQTSVSPLTRLFQERIQLYPEKNCREKRTDHCETIDDYFEIAPFYVDLIKALQQESARLSALLLKQKALNTQQKTHVQAILTLIRKIKLGEDLLPQFTMSSIRQLFEQVDNDSPLYDPALSGFSLASQVSNGSSSKSGEKYVYFPKGSPLRQFMCKYRMELTIWTLDNLKTFFKEYFFYYAQEKAMAGHEAWPVLDDKCKEVMHALNQLIIAVNTIRAALRLREYSDTEIRIANKSLEDLFSDIKLMRAKPQKVDVAELMTATPPLSVPVVLPTVLPANRTNWLEIAMVAGAMLAGLAALAILVVATHGAIIPLLVFIGVKLSFGLLGGGTLAAEVVGSTVVGALAATVAGTLGWLAEKGINKIRQLIWPTVNKPSALCSQTATLSDAAIRNCLATEKIAEKAANVAEQAAKEVHGSLSSFRRQSPGYLASFLTFFGGQAMRSRHHSAVDLAQYERVPHRPLSPNSNR